MSDTKLDLLLRLNPAVFRLKELPGWHVLFIPDGSTYSTFIVNPEEAVEFAFDIRAERGGNCQALNTWPEPPYDPCGQVCALLAHVVRPLFPCLDILDGKRGARRITDPIRPFER